MKLADYLSSTNRQLADFASEVGDVTVSGVRKWLREERVPRPDQMRRIYEITHGKVTPNDFYLEAQP